ncbi:hypothetical protein GCM10009077_38380 [Roseibium denhamense]
MPGEWIPAKPGVAKLHELVIAVSGKIESVAHEVFANSGKAGEMAIKVSGDCSVTVSAHRQDI